MGMKCANCGAENPDTGRFCQQCGGILAAVTPASYSQAPLPIPAPKKTEPWVIPLVIVLVAVTIIAGIAVGFLLLQAERKADLDTSNMQFLADYYSDTVDVWVTVTNIGDGSAFYPITLYFTVSVDGVPSYNQATLSENELLPGETANGRWTFPTDYQYLDSTIYVTLTKITWLE